MEVNVRRRRAIQTRLRGPAQEIEFQQYPDGIRTTIIKDHTGANITLAWQQRADKLHEGIPSFPFQIYILQNVIGNGHDHDRAAKIAACLSVIDTNAYCRYDVYGQRFSNALECVEHQRHEVQWRNRNGIWPRLVETWSPPPREAYRGCIIVIYAADWEAEGVAVVEFDPANILGDVSRMSQTDLVTVTRQQPEKLHEEMLRIWRNAGHTWTQADLMRRNDGGFSPALYPAVDPAARNDVEHGFDDPIDLPGPAINEDTGIERSAGDQDADDSLTTAEMWRNISLPDDGLKIESYEGLSGNVIESIWSAERGNTRPPLAFTLYCGAIPYFHSAALFRCLNRRQMGSVPWTLDVVRNFSTPGEALKHFGYESPRRTQQCTEKRRLCTQMLLNKIAGDRLPTELLEQIEDILLPPYMPRLAEFWEHCFLYVDASSKQTLLEGPLLVRANAPDTSRHVQEGSSTNVEQHERSRECLAVTTLRSWDAVTQIMYGYFYKRYYQMRSASLHGQ
ncbi:hypothetical protein LTR86_005166 [Recurvomyces mirabilis]|nr:hypothetical protein LTR86_005166 [Recurvomyces mirabilis]